MSIYVGVTKRGRRLSAYLLGCGYIEVRRLGQVQTKLFRRYGVYFVRCHDFENGVRVFEEAFTSLRRARARFNRCRGRLIRNRGGF